MAKDAGKKSFLDFFRDREDDDEYDDEFEDDLFDDDEEDDDYYSMPKSKSSYSKPKAVSSSNTRSFEDRKTVDNSYNVRPQTRTGTGNGKLVEFNGRKAIKSKMNGEVYVIQPRDIEDTDIIVDNLLDGYVVIINLEGVEIGTAQRIVDFVGGATKAIDGSIVPITGNIFVATAFKDAVSGNIRMDHSSQIGYNY